MALRPLGPADHGPVRPDEWAYYLPLVGNSMLELGGKYNPAAGQTYKAHFEAMGMRHVSIDWNGEHGAVNRDLRRPLWDEFGQFHMVCNIGTTEHVDGQRGVWANIHHMTKPGGVIVSVTPYWDGLSWWWHGLWYPKEEFFEWFANTMGYVIERIGIDLEPPNMNLYVRLRKLKHEPVFTWPANWEEMIVRNQVRPRDAGPVA